MKETEPKIALSEGPAKNTLTAADHQQALELATGDLLFTSLNAYESHLSGELEKIQIAEAGEALLRVLIENGTFGSSGSIKRILLTPLALRIMYIIWRESDYVTENAVSAAGIGRPFRKNSRHLTRNSLKNAICDDLGHLTASGGDAVKRSIDRICDALEVYGMLARVELRPNLKPHNGTHLLHIVMSNTCRAASHVFARQLQTEESTHNG